MAFPRQTQALLVLGYSLVSIRSNPSLFPSFILEDANSMIYVADILDRLASLDVEIEDNIRDSMAVKVQDLGLDYGAYISNANISASKLLHELSTALSVPLISDKYIGKGKVTSVKNYC
jgi:hypothetical protein